MFRLTIFFFCLSISIFAQSTFLIGIAGGTGSGKTTLATKIHEAFPEAIVISQDSYYKDLSFLSEQERGQKNFDHPDSLEFSLLREHLLALKEGFSIEQPIYSFHTHARANQFLNITPTNIILYEYKRTICKNCETNA